jgi:hypothetical protein
VISHNASVEYERFADIYSVWTATAPSARANHAFYVDTYRSATGPVPCRSTRRPCASGS